MSEAATFDDLRDLYQETILSRSRHPRHGERLAAFDASAKGDNPMCGDRVQVFVKRAPDGTIAETGFEARGCAISIASADLMADAVRALSPAQTATLFERFRALVQTGKGEGEALEPLLPLAGVHEFPSRVKCATLPWHALLAALNTPTETRHG
jgi:nitrogen fixation NifU-like protein